jgi:hypothetical protein
MPGQSFSANARYRYTIAQQNQRLFLDFRSPNANSLQRRELSWFVGSGAAARSFLIAVDGFLYEAPATFYSRTSSWAPSPGYDRYNYPFLTRAIAPGCLVCHATGVQAIEGTQNGYGSPPFLEGGIGCERCHGPGAAHAASGKAADIVNPARLPAPERDSVCAQCHLSGEIRIERAGQSMSDFTAGRALSDYAISFMRASATPGMRVTSHVENLMQSACSRGSGSRLWCGTCHDPHDRPSTAGKASWFRTKCQTCHASTECQRGENCIACHMPASAVNDADHVVYTDHSIPRRAIPRNGRPPSDAPLTAFGNVSSDARDQGVAYATVAARERNAVYAARAFDLLREAERHDPNDPQTLAWLADLYKGRKDDRSAVLLYRRLNTLDRTESAAPANLGAYQLEQGHYDEAIRLFQDALRVSPALVLVRLNLAAALIHQGQKAEARLVLEKALEFNPSFTAARDLLSRIR